jgi:UDP-N-acetylglucosamine acyltransferase
MASIHPTAIVEPGAQLADSVKIGPYCVVGEDVTLEDDVELVSHVVVAGHTRIGARSRVFPFASIGHQPQDLKYRGERTSLIIGAQNIIREHVTMNPGTVGGGGVTQVGDNGLFMATMWSWRTTRPWGAMWRSGISPSSADCVRCINSCASGPTP